MNTLASEQELQPNKSAGGGWARHRHDHTKADPSAASACSKCRWAAFGKRWRSCTPLDSNAKEVVSWLLAKPVDTPDCAWGVGCKACSWAAKSHGVEGGSAQQTPYATLSVTRELRLSNFKRYVASTNHKQMVIAYL